MHCLALLPFITFIRAWPYPFITLQTESNVHSRRQFDPEEIENIVSLAEGVYALIQDENNVAVGINDITNAWAKEFAGDKSLPFVRSIWWPYSKH
jgi:hypothetical protein